jgi:hypothetical protein
MSREREEHALLSKEKRKCGETDGKIQKVINEAGTD